MREDPPPTEAADARRQEILGAAFDVFRRYGFRRTSMEDIAREAGLSRAALYLHYKNKQDIFRSLAAFYFAQAEARVQQALTPGAPVETALAAVFAAKAGPEMEALLESPHGAELLDANFSVCTDIVKDGEARFVALLTTWLSAEAKAGRIALEGDAATLARVIMAAQSGQKNAAAGFAAYREAGERLAALFARGLRH